MHETRRARSPGRGTCFFRFRRSSEITTVTKHGRRKAAARARERDATKKNPSRGCSSLLMSQFIDREAEGEEEDGHGEEDEDENDDAVVDGLIEHEPLAPDRDGLHLHAAGGP